MNGGIRMVDGIRMIVCEKESLGLDRNTHVKFKSAR
jgi:hypothetical protein